jgi:LuxR family maltose regulon positive regulatory protein
VGISGVDTTVVEGDLVSAQLEPPRPVSAIVSRPRLLGMLENAASGPITVISGEPAAGKTSLVLDWLASVEAEGRPTAWLAIPSELDDPIAFWRYLLATVDPLGVTTEDLYLSLADDEPPNERWLTTLANRLAAVGPLDPLIVVDDLHELRSDRALDELLGLLERLPDSVHVVIVSRAIPPWELSGWRMSGRLSEIGSDDLSFTIDEARAMVQAAEIELGEDDVAQLVTRTTGWAGGLRLALISMRHSTDRSAFIARFAADDELVASFLFREVLERQEPNVRDFLLDVSILTHFSPDLCDALRGRTDSGELIESCRSQHLFIRKSEGDGSTFRLHELFSQLLRVRLELEDAGRLIALHRRASTIFEDLGDIGLAIRHALAAKDEGRTGELVSRYAPVYARNGRFDEIRSWTSILRRSSSPKNVEIELALALIVAICGQPAHASRQLDLVNEAGLSRRLRYARSQTRSVIQHIAGRVDRLAELAAALERDLADADYVGLHFEPERTVSTYLGIAAFFDDDIPRAHAALERAAARRERPDVLYIESAGWLARVAHAAGELDESEWSAHDSLIRNVELAGGETAVVTPAYLALGDVAWERGQLDEADVMLAKALRSIRPLLWEAVLIQASASRVLASRGDLAQARTQLIECAHTYLQRDSAPQLHTLVNTQFVDLALRMDDLEEAHRWELARAEQCDRPLPASLQLRLRAAQGTADVRALVDQALAVDQPVPGQIDTLLAAAALVGRAGDQGRCVGLVGRAALLAAPNRFIQRFLDADDPVHAALRTLVSKPPAPTGAPTLSPLFLEQLASALDVLPGPAEPTNQYIDSMVEPLSKRERQVLDLLVAGRSYLEIGSALYVSRNTVKTHASHIYAKLGVSGRTAATERARELGLI